MILPSPETASVLKLLSSSVISASTGTCVPSGSTSISVGSYSSAQPLLYRTAMVPSAAISISMIYFSSCFMARNQSGASTCQVAPSSLDTTRPLIVLKITRLPSKRLRSPLLPSLFAKNSVRSSSVST